MTTENKIRRKASRRGYRVGKYRSGYDSSFIVSDWTTGRAEIWNATLEEVEAFIDSQPLEQSAIKGGSR